jgi:hypothetical protein
MRVQMFERIAAALRLVRPREIAQTRHSLDQLTRDVRALSDSIRDLDRLLREQQASLSAIDLRESQLRAVAERDAELDDRLATLDRTLEAERIGRHVGKAIVRSSLNLDPFPYCVVDDLFPESFYNALIDGLPPYALFADRPPNKQQMTVPFGFAPEYGRRVWRFMSDVIVREYVAPAVLAKFREPLDAWMRESFPDQAATSVDTLVSSDGRLLLRTRGYRIKPHRDPKWGFVTGILYLAKPGDSEQWGTDLYTVDADEEARGAAPYWIDETKCRQAASIGYRRNRLLLFLNSRGAHGAVIPEDAEPADLKRFIYQFRLGPDGPQIRALEAALTPEKRVLWEGKQRSY